MLVTSEFIRVCQSGYGIHIMDPFSEVCQFFLQTYSLLESLKRLLEQSYSQKKTFSSLLSQYWRPAISLYKDRLIGFPSSNDIVTNGPFAKRMRNEFELKDVLLCRIFVIAHRSAQKSGARSEEVSIEQILNLR